MDTRLKEDFPNMGESFLITKFREVVRRRMG
jgi:hypothetical protein